MPSTFEDNLKKLVDDTKDIKSDYAKMPPAVKAKDSNYRNAISMVYEAQDKIKELRDQIKKGSMTAVDELKKWQTNYEKIFARVKPCTDEVANLKKSLDGLKGDVNKAQKTAEQLNKDAARSAMADVKTAAAQLKAAVADLKSIADGIQKQIQALADLPKEPSKAFA